MRTSGAGRSIPEFSPYRLSPAAADYDAIVSVRTAFATVSSGFVLVAAAGAAGVPLSSLSDPFDDAGMAGKKRVRTLLPYLTS